MASAPNSFPVCIKRSVCSLKYVMNKCGFNKSLIFCLEFLVHHCISPETSLNFLFIDKHFISYLFVPKSTEMFTEIFTYARSVLLAMGVSSPSIFLFFFTIYKTLQQFSQLFSKIKQKSSY